jgi:hemerythrin
MRNYEDCRPYVDHLLAEHRRLHGMLHRARNSIVHSGGPDHDASTADIVRVLRQIREELAQHFAEEEAGGCLEEAACHCPRLTPDVKTVEAEHAELLAEIDRLIAEALDSEQSVANRIQLLHDFEQLYHALCAHEAAENTILRQAFGSNLNGDEAEAPVIQDY